MASGFQTTEPIPSLKEMQLREMEKQIEKWLKLIPTMEGYVEEDLNPLAELESYLTEAEDALAYALREL